MRRKKDPGVAGVFLSKVIPIFLIQVILTLSVSAQVGKSFWFAAPDILQFEFPNYLRVTTLSKEATVTISQPANPNFVPIVQKVPANSNYSFNVTFYANDFENIGADIITQKGILIESTNKIMAYYEPTQQYNPDIYALKGSNALGTDFIITSQKLWESYNNVPSSFYVLATEDATTINITPSVDLVGHPKSAGTFSKVLQRGEVYVADAVGVQGIDHVGGSIVTSDKPIVVTMTNDLTSPPGGCGDQNGDQLIPSSIAGNEFITLPGNLNVSGITDLVYVYPTVDGTQITVNGVDMGTKNRGEYLEVQNKGQTRSITTSKPSVVYQVSGTGCEVGGAAVPTINCTGSTTVGVTRASSEGFTMLLLVKDGGEGNFKFNGLTGVIKASDFQAIPNNTGGWKYATIALSQSQLPTGSGALIKNTTPFHLGVINGVFGGTRYGYFSSFGGFEPDIFLTPNTFGDLYTDFIGNTYQWYRNGVLIDGATNATYTATESGNYSIEVTYGASCPPARSEEIPIGLTPANIGKYPSLWLRADKNIELTGSNVSGWLDQSGSDNHHAQSDVSKQPGYSNKDANFNPSLTFNGSQWIFDNDGIFKENTTFNESDVYIVHNSKEHSNRGLYGQYVMYGDNNLKGRFMAHGDFGDGSQYFGLISYNTDASWVTLGSDAARLNAYVINSYSMTEGKHSLWFNGGDSTGAPTSVKEFKRWDPVKPFAVGAAPVQDGSGSGSFNFKQKGNIPEIIVFTEELSISDRHKVESYLGIKYGNTLLHNYYTTLYDGTNSDSTTAYDISTYGYNIAGIARDDKGNLYQKQSRSQNSVANSRIVTMGVGEISPSNAENTNTFDDGIYMVWGDDNADVTESSTDVNQKGLKRIKREWKIQVLGKSPSNVQANFNLDGLSFSGSTPDEFKLLVDRDGDGDFSTGKIDEYAAAEGSTITSLTFDNITWDSDSSGQDVFTLQTLPGCNLSEVSVQGKLRVVAGSSQTYTASAKGATSYTWSVPSGWVGTSTTDSIKLVAGSVGGILSVVANSNGCSTPADTAILVIVPDFDGDAIADEDDFDDDNDGIIDSLENTVCDPSSDSCDTDDDGIPNKFDLDSDADGISDVYEANGTDANFDGKADGAVDENGVPASASGGLIPTDTDSDGQSNPYDIDSDGDAIPDSLEKGVDGTSPIDTDKDGDPDFLDLDSDNDGIPDSVEKGVDGTKPLDTDNDGTPDYLDLDSDNDGIPDNVEAGTDPETPLDTDNDGIPDYRQLDSDNDGIPDTDEAGPDPSIPIDSDSDGIPDFRELDSTNDGIPDNETLLIFKTATKPVLSTDGSISYTYTITLRNARKEPLNNVQVTDDLTKTFVSPMTFKVESVNTTAGLSTAAGYDGRAQVNLLAPNVTLGAYGKETIEIAVKVLPNGYSGNINNTADGSAVAKWFNVTRYSIDTTASNGRKHGAGHPTQTVPPIVDVKISEAITPDNNGFNDKWIILRPSNVKVSVTVFNRWGQIVYKAADYKNDWSGTGTNGVLGNLLPQGTYFYLVELSGGTFTTKEVRKGYLTIKRDY